ncbi:cytochrome P450 2C5-like [Daphnia pulex]|uniref:cytochrome P450 2C5-like n=1 Tax=Daphnia pulex TaxID=6669 RepID=UPI001EDFDA81|nr:cytochrome P450 2C5-like [Daphnia pulex]XP_046464673.1 cytochrome P450 2C5-like [Daphnia pulex]
METCASLKVRVQSNAHSFLRLQQPCEMFNLVLIAVAILLLPIAINLMWRKQSKSYRLPPGPKRNPVFGNLLDLIHSSIVLKEAPFLKFSKWAFQYGPICYLRFFRQRVVVISDARVAQQLCVGQSDKFSTRPPGLFLSRILKGRGIVFNDGLSWKEHRNFVTHEFRKFGFGNQAIEQRIQIVVDEYLHEISRTEGLAHDPHPNIATAIYNVIWTTISGEKFNWDDPFLRKIIANLETNLQAVELTGPHNYVTILSIWHLIWHNAFRLLIIVLKRLSYFKQLICKFKNQRKEAPISEVEDSMMYDYLVKMQGSKTSGESTDFSETQLLWLVSDLFIAGGETTVTSLRWALLCLAKFPKVQERLRQEIVDTFGRDSTPTYSQRSQLPYMEAFIQETLRFNCSVPGMWRNTAQDATYENYEIPKDTWVLLHFWAMSNNKSLWEDVREFKPERFLNDDGTFKKNENFLAFSAGKRQCPGESLARTELFLFTLGILQKFIVTLPDGQDVDIHSGQFGVTYTPPHHDIRFIPIDTA